MKRVKYGNQLLIVVIFERNTLRCLFLQLTLVQISEMIGFGRTFNDCEPLSNMEAELNDVFAVQLYPSGTQQLDSSSAPHQVPIVAINALPCKATDDVAT